MQNRPANLIIYLMEAKVIFYGMCREENLAITGEHYQKTV